MDLLIHELGQNILSKGGFRMNGNITINKENDVRRNKKSSRKKEIWRNLKKNKGAMMGLIILVFFTLVAIFADVIASSEGIAAQNSAIRLQTPSVEHWFGTDGYGRDVFTRVVHGSRVSLTIGFVTAGASLLIGGALGASAAYYGGRIENIIMRFMDMLTAIPATLLALSIVAALGPSMVNLLIAISIASIPGFTRLIRSVVLTVVDMDFIEAARAYGATDYRIITKYVLPNAMGPIIVNTTQSIASMILQAAGLSFIGMGVQPPRPEWGSMLSEAREFMRIAPYLLIFPGFSIILTALSFNLLGDGFRDAFDPRLKN